MPTKVHLVKAMVFSVVMYGCESWTIKKAECQRIDAFELWCWRRLFRVPWTARRSIQSILKEISPEYSLEGLMLKLKLPSFGHLMWKTYSFEKTMMLGKIEGRRRRERRAWGGWMVLRTWVWVNSGSWWWTGKPGMIKMFQIRNLMKLIHVGSCFLIIIKRTLSLGSNPTTITKMGDPWVITRTLVGNRRFSFWDHLWKVINAKQPPPVRQSPSHHRKLKQKRGPRIMRNREGQDTSDKSALKIQEEMHKGESLWS